MKIEIAARLPSWNTFYAGANHRARTAIKNQWRMLVRAALDVDIEPCTKVVHITVYAEYKGTPCDVDNVMAKLVIDGLKGWVVREDDPSCVSGVTCHSRNSKRNYVTVVIDEHAE